MKPPKFHVGQAVVCVNPGKSHEEVAQPPKSNQIYTVSRLEYYRSCQIQDCLEGWYIGLCELPAIQMHHEMGYAPVELASDEALAELLEEAFTPVTV